MPQVPIPLDQLAFSSFLKSVVLIGAALNPEPDSAKKGAAIISPLASFGEQRFLCMWLPNSSQSFKSMELRALIISDAELA